MELKNYLFVTGHDSDNCHVVSPEECEKFRIMGNVYGRQGFCDGSMVMTSSIKDLNGDIAITESGSRYSLSEMNEDYKEYIKAKKNGVPIITSWRLRTDTIMDRMPDSIEDIEKVIEYIKNVKQHKAILFVGEMSDGKSITGDIVSQRGNYITLEVSSPDDALKIIEKEFFVLWPNLDFEVMTEIKFSGKYTYLDYEDHFEDSFGLKRRPNLSAYINWRKEYYKKTAV